MKKTFLHLILLSVVSLDAAAAQDLSPKSLDRIFQQGLQFLSQTQFPTGSGYYNPGEWPVEMKSYLIPSLVGLGRLWALPSQEPTAFATASVLNSLSEAYLLDQNFKAVPQIIRQALPSFEIYKHEDVFFYYPMSDFQGLKLHVPRDPHYVPRKMMSLALVPPDADTTSVTYTALAFADFILHKKPMSQYPVPEGTFKTLEKFRDLDRKPHPYNRLNGGVKNSGAYMTWLWDENDENSTFWRSMSAQPEKGYRIIFGRNDVDCVVNANVLRMMLLTNHQNQPGFENSCQLLNESITKSKNMISQAKYCGIYYPNTFGAIYSISNVYKAGASCLRSSRDQAIRLILSRQNVDGSWSNDVGIGREDRVQSTASALNALLNYVDISDRRYEHVVRTGAQFLVSQMRTKENGQIYWAGEVFFSAGPAARSAIMWRSDAYTTALSLLSLVKAKVYLKSEVLP